MDQPTGSKFRPHHPSIVLRNLLPGNDIGGHPTGVLLLGDSIEMCTLGDVCSLYGVELEQGPVDQTGKRWWESQKCVTDAFNVLFAKHIGVHPDGPYHLKYQKEQNSWEMSRHAVDVFRHQFGGADPDITVISQNLWDIAGLPAHNAGVFDAAMGADFPALPRSFLDGWRANFTSWVGHVRALLPPGAFIVYHTTALPQANEATGQCQKKYLGHTHFVAQLNRVGSQAAAELGIPTVDIEAMTSGLGSSVALRDAHHPAPFVLLEAFNLYLNLHQGCTQGAAGRAAKGGAEAAAEGTADAEVQRRAALAAAADDAAATQAAEAEAGHGRVVAEQDNLQQWAGAHGH